MPRISSLDDPVQASRRFMRAVLVPLLADATEADNNCIAKVFFTEFLGVVRRYGDRATMHEKENKDSCPRTGQDKVL